MKPRNPRKHSPRDTRPISDILFPSPGKEEYTRNTPTTHEPTHSGANPRTPGRRGAAPPLHPLQGDSPEPPLTLPGNGFYCRNSHFFGTCISIAYALRATRAKGVRASGGLASLPRFACFPFNENGPPLRSSAVFPAPSHPPKFTTFPDKPQRGAPDACLQVKLVNACRARA